MVSAPGITLALDASTYVGTVAVLRDGALVSERDALMRGEHEERLMPAVIAALADVGALPGDVARVICGGGPGSFTSLRIAGAIGKGIAMANDVPLFAVSSLALVVAGAPSLAPGAYLASLDAMRGDRYVQPLTVGADGAVTIGASASIVAGNAVEPLAASTGAAVIGPQQAVDAAPHARGVARLLGAIREAGPVALDAWEPAYGRLAEAQVKWEAAHGRPLGMP
jgi:tRNA threonylcarbamoyladenosine biosynthesis protein TsaB